MNVGFIKRLFFYRDIEGITDIRKELNYFKHFGITDEECIDMLSMLKENEKNLSSFRNKLYEKILFQIDYYSKHKLEPNGKFTWETDPTKVGDTRSVFSSHLYFGLRILAQEYWYIRNIVKTSFNPVITVPAFGKNKYTYTDYIDSIKFFYREITFFHMITVDKSESTFNRYLNQDELINKGVYNLKAYKKIFMLIWMYTYARIADNIFQYGLEYESENPKTPYFRPNLLSPIDIVLVQEDESINEDIRKRREKDLRIRESYEIKRKIQETNIHAAKSLELYEGLDFTVNDFTTITQCMGDVFEYQSTLLFEDFITILENRISTVLREKKIPKEILVAYIEKLCISDKDIEVQDDLHPFTRPLIMFEFGKKRYIHCEFEIMYFFITLLSTYKFIEKDKIKEFYNIYFPLINKIAILEVVNATRKFKVKWYSLRKHYFWLENKKAYSMFFNLVDDIIYFPDTKMLVYIYWCNVLPQTKSWGLYNEDFQIVVGKEAIARAIVKNKVTLIEMHYEQIKKIFKITEDISTKTIILFDGNTSLETRQVIENHVVNLCPIKCIADFFVNDVYKK